ncbi:hypothetical protein ACIBL5_00500 [Streptomyces sp. NPDC050516]|uniref:phage terminase small subunit n=1 Tax=Streptomyces sp. NPDC050516 TaxID=3365621 RepID=UPI0037AB0EB3
MPPADEGWHPIASGWYLSLGESGQAVLYQPSDWAKARYVAELMSRTLRLDRPSGHLVTSLHQAMTGLLATEGDRRRSGVELSRKPEQSW